MNYVANPVIVEAHRITEVRPRKQSAPGDKQEWRENGQELLLENGLTAFANDMMLARIEPKAGDYWVIQQDGYAYLNPKGVFERKYSTLHGDGARLYVILQHHGVGSMYTTGPVDHRDLLTLPAKELTERYLEQGAAALQNQYRETDAQPIMDLPPLKG